MTDELNAKGRIEIELKNAKKAIEELHAIREELATGQVDADRYEKSVGQVESTLGKVAAAAAKAEKAVGQASVATRGWSQSMASLHKQELSGKNASSAFGLNTFGQDLKVIQALDPALGAAARSQQALNRERKRSDNRTAAAAWDREFSAMSKLTSANENLISQRYALYDVATTYGAIGAALLGLDAYAISTGANFEKAFTQVERTLQTGQSTRAIAEIRQELADLSTQIPLTFEEISKIAQLGNQLGIEASNITKFTKTVAQFSAVTGIGVEETALAFGQLGNLLGVSSDQYDRLGSSIALVGVNSAATESQIVSVAREIAPAARAAGFTAEQVIGLSGALSSIRVPPERSRSTILQFFETLNMAVANGGKDLQNFAAVVGVTAGELESMVRSGQGESIFRRFIDSAAAADTVEITQALQELGLAGLRTNPTIRALADNTALLNSTFSDAAKGYGENTELARQYAMIADDLASQFQMLVNAVNAFVDAASGGSIAGIAELVGIVTDLVNGAREFISTPLGQTFARLTMTAIALVGGIAAVRAAQALATASTYALVTAQSALGASSGMTGLKGLVSILLGYTKTANGATVSTLTLSAALRALARATIILGLIQLAMDLILDFSGAMNKAADIAQWLAEGVKKLAAVFDVFFGIMSHVGGILGTISSGLANLARAAWYAMTGFLALLPAARSLVGGVGAVGKSIDASKRSADGAASSADSFADSLGGVGSGAAGAAKQVRTLVDYGNDLSQVFKRAFDIRFSGQQGLDAIATGWRDIAKAMDEARMRALELEAQIQGLTADRGTREFWLSVAINYGDDLRADEIRAEIAKIDADLAKASADLAAEQDKTNKTLVGNSDAAIGNRSEILSLVSTYQDYVAALASSGLPQDQLLARTQQLKADFMAQATQLGYNSAELGIYAAAFDDVTVAINGVPRNITVEANVDPAIQALNELVAHAGRVGGAAGGAFGSGFRESVPDLTPSGSVAGEQFRKGFTRALNGAKIYADGSVQFSPGGGNALTLRAYSSGGYVGDGGRFAPRGVVHGGEYVFSQPAVRAIGVGNLNQMHQAAKGGGGVAGMTGGYVQLSPTDRALLQQIADRVGITITPNALAGAVNGSNTNSSNRRVI